MKAQLVVIAALTATVVAQPASASIVGSASVSQYLKVDFGGSNVIEVPVSEPNVTSYANTITRNADILLGQGPYLFVPSNPTTTTSFNQDLINGAISGSISWDLDGSGYAGEPRKNASGGINAEYNLTSAYSYTFRLTETSIGSNTSNLAPFSMSIGTGTDIIYTLPHAAGGPIDFYSAGLLGPGTSLSINASGVGCTDGCSYQGFDTGNLQFAMTLTPVPIPAAAWLLLSGLGGLGTLVRRRLSDVA